MAQRSDEHRSLVGSRWNVRHRLRFCVLQKLHVLLVHKSEVVLELETELQPDTESVVQQVSGLLPCSSPLNHSSATMRKFPFAM